MDLMVNDAKIIISEETKLVESVLINEEELYLSESFDEIYKIFEDVYKTEDIVLIHKDEIHDINYFINLINKINNDLNIESELVPDYSSDYEIDDEDELPKIKMVKKCYISEKVEQLACDYLIEGNGRPNYDNISKLNKNGIKVGPGETDSFGWLSGMIKTNKGIIIFG